MDAIPKRELLIDGAIVFLGFIIFFVVFGIFRSGMEDDVVAITRAHMAIREGNEAVAVLAKLKQDAPKAADYTKQLNFLLPKREELLGFTRALDTASRASNVQFRFGFQGGAVPGGEGKAGFIAFNLEAVGAYQNLTTFLANLESKSSRFLVALDGLGTEPLGGGYRFQTHGKLFYREE